MKSVEDWNRKDKNGKIQNGNGDNSSGFNGVPGGSRSNYGNFPSISYSACFWSSTENDNFCAYVSTLYILDSFVAIGFTIKKGGHSVRCIKDSSDSKWVQTVRAVKIKPYIPPGLNLK
jgi:uncharacterized protein (TIGR02145 family)